MRKIHWFPIGKVEHLFVLFVRQISDSQNISVNSGVSVSTIDKLFVADEVYLTHYTNGGLFQCTLHWQ